MYYYSILFNLITGSPVWNGTHNDSLDIEYECYNFTNSTVLLLNILWPEISNIDDMDLDFYSLSIKIYESDGQENPLINSTIKTDATSYECIFLVPEPSNNLMAQVQINAVNRCNDTSIVPLWNSIDIDKGIMH